MGRKNKKNSFSAELNHPMVVHALIEHYGRTALAVNMIRGCFNLWAEEEIIPEAMQSGISMLMRATSELNKFSDALTHLINDTSENQILNYLKMRDLNPLKSKAWDTEGTQRSYGYGIHPTAQKEAWKKRQVKWIKSASKPTIEDFKVKWKKLTLKEQTDLRAFVMKNNTQKIEKRRTVSVDENNGPIQSSTN